MHERFSLALHEMERNHRAESGLDTYAGPSEEYSDYAEIFDDMDGFIIEDKDGYCD